MFKTLTSYTEGGLDQKLNDFSEENTIDSFSYSIAAMGATQVYSVLVRYMPRPKLPLDRSLWEGPYVR